MVKEKLHELEWSPLITTSIAYIMMLINIALIGLKFWCQRRSDEWEKLHIRVNLIHALHGIIDFIFSIFIQYKLFVKGRYGK